MPDEADAQHEQGREPRRHSLDLDDARRIDAACCEFEARWRAGEPVSIEALLARTPVAAGDVLLFELVALERELRGAAGESVGIEDYRQRFPGRAAVIEDVFQLATPGRNWPALPSKDGDRGPDRTDPGDVTLPVTRPADPDPGSQRFGPFELLDEIAHGGMGAVYRARHLGLDRVVALKMIRSGRYATSAERQRFLREARIAASLDHPHIVPIYDVGEAAGHVYFTMKLIEGRSLAAALPELRQDLRGGVRLLASVARAVHYAHERGLVHRDLKPANVLLDTRGHPHVTDFGLARPVSEDSALTESGAILGTPSYMAPEQASGQARRVTAASDTYSLGAILYELLTGRPPFQTPTVMETLVQVLELDPVAPRERNPGIPRALERVCLKCLEKAPERRYTTAAALAEDLERFLGGETPEADRGGWSQSLRRWARREPELAVHLGALALVAALTEWNRWWRPPDRPIPYRAIESLFVLWTIASVAFQFHLRRTPRPDAVRLAWTTTDLAALSAILYLREAADTSLVVGYTVIIAAVGLWSREALVWAATAVAIAAYGLIYLLALWAQDIPRTHRFPNVVFAALLVTASIVTQQIRRFWSLSSYYGANPRDRGGELS